MPRGYSDPLPVPPDVIATMHRVRERGPDDLGCINLMGAFWKQIHRDLQAGAMHARRYLDTHDFAIWCDACRLDPAIVRERLIELYWSPVVLTGRPHR